MQTFGSQISKHPTQGFTLVEILVVLFIVTIITGLTITQLPAFVQQADMEREGQRLELLINMARNEAILDSQQFGMRLTDEGYEFLQFDDESQKWLRASAPFQERMLPDEIKLDLRKEKSDFSVLGDDLPPILILSSGETTPFRFRLSSSITGDERVLTTDGYGELKWQEDE